MSFKVIYIYKFCQYNNTAHFNNIQYMIMNIGFSLFVCVLRPIDSEVIFRDGTPIYCHLRRTRSSVNTPFQPGIEPRAVA